MASRIEDEIDAQTVAAEVLLLRAATNNTIFIVEGASDEKVFINFIDTDQCEIVLAHGKSNAIDAIAIIKGQSLSGVLCVVDKDFATVLNDAPSSQDIFLTDDHDLETMIFRSDAFERVLSELGSTTKISTAKSRWPEIRTPIVLAAYPIGLLRLYSLINLVHLKFEDAKTTYVDRRTLAVDLDLMIKIIADHSKMLVDRNDIHAFFDRWPINLYDPWHICCGHDLAEMFGKSLQTLLGSRRAIEVDLASVERALRLAYSFYDFSLTQLFNSIKQWERNNSRVCLRY